MWRKLNCVVLFGQKVSFLRYQYRINVCRDGVWKFDFVIYDQFLVEDCFCLGFLLLELYYLGKIWIGNGGQILFFNNYIIRILYFNDIYC